MQSTCCCRYGAVSISITLFNKAVFSYYHFPYPNMVTTLQILVSLVYMGVLARLKVMHFEKLSWDMAKQVRLKLPAGCQSVTGARPGWCLCCARQEHMTEGPLAAA